MDMDMSELASTKDKNHKEQVFKHTISPISLPQLFS